MSNRMNLVVWLIWLAITLVVPACNDSKNEMPETPVIPEEPEIPEELEIPQLQNREYTCDDNITINYSVLLPSGVGKSYDYLLEGEKIKIINHGDNKGEVVYYSDDFDLNSIEDNPISGILQRPTYLGIGKEISFPMEFTTDDGGETFFGKGKAEANGVKITLEIQIEKDNAILDYDISMGNYFDNDYSSFPSTDFESTIFIQEPPVRGHGTHYDYSPIIAEWMTNDYPEKLKDYITPSDFLQILLHTPFLDENKFGFDRNPSHMISISQLLGRIGSGVAFSAGFYPRNPGFAIGGISKVTNPNDANETHIWSRTTIGLFESNITNSSFILTVDPFKIFNFFKIAKESEWEDEYFYYSSKYYPVNKPCMYSLLSHLLLALSPGNVEGIPMDYSIYRPDASRIRFKITFSQQDVSISFLKNLLLPLLESEDNRQRLISNLKQDKATAPYIDDLVYMIETLDELLSSSSYLNFGWIFSRIVGESNEQHTLKENTYKYLYNQTM